MNNFFQKETCTLRNPIPYSSIIYLSSNQVKDLVLTFTDLLDENFCRLAAILFIGIWAIDTAFIRISFPYVYIVQHWSVIVNSFFDFF